MVHNILNELERTSFEPKAVISPLRYLSHAIISRKGGSLLRANFLWTSLTFSQLTTLSPNSRPYPSDERYLADTAKSCHNPSIVCDGVHPAIDTGPDRCTNFNWPRFKSPSHMCIRPKSMPADQLLMTGRDLPGHYAREIPAHGLADN